VRGPLPTSQCRGAVPPCPFLTPKRNALLRYDNSRLIVPLAASSS
jgi:hypothetical protein